MPSYLMFTRGGDPLWLADGRADDGWPRPWGVDPGPLIMVVTFVGFVGGYTKAVLGVDDVLLGALRRRAW